MKKTLLFLAFLLGIALQSWAYDFEAIAPSGQTLYYNIVDGNAEVASASQDISGSLTIPSSVTYNGTTYSVTSIGNSAFENYYRGLTSVTIPNSVISIGGRAFYYCSGLTSVTIGNSVTSIGRHAFFCCSGLTSVTIPNSVTSIGNYAFEGCSGLTSVYYTGDVAGWCGITFGSENANPLWYAHNLYINGSLVTDLVIPSGVTEIKDYAFIGATCLTSVYYTGDVAGWCGITFGGMSNPLVYAHNLYINGSLVTDLVIPSGVTEIKDYAFIEATCLTSVTIPNSVTSIGEGAFEYCSGLTSVTIGNSVTSIGNYAFYGCTGLTEINSHNHVAPYAAEYAFRDIPLSIPVYIPCGSMASYLSRWSYFSNFFEDEAFTFSAVSADNNMGAVQILTMPTCTNPQAVIYASANSGYRFDHWSDGNTANPRVLTVTEDTELTGYFVPDGGGTQGIDDKSPADGMKVYSRGNRIVVETVGASTQSQNDAITVYDVMGRVVKQAAGSGQQAAVEIPVTSAGVYMVKVGERPSRKVIVKP